MPDSQPQFLEFPVDARAITRGIIGFAVVTSTAGLTITGTLYALGMQNGDTTLFSAIFLALYPLLFGRWMWRMSRGVARLKPDALEVVSRGSVRRYRWQDISELRLKTVATSDASFRIWARTIGVGADQRLVELRLKRSVRIAILPGKYEHGTDIFGIPSLVGRMARLFPVDPDGFVQAATALLQAPSLSYSA